MARRMPSAPAEETDCIEDALHPRRTVELIGHDEALHVASRQIRGGRPPQGWLIAGPPGIGKATLAYRIARYLLAYGATQDGPEDLSVEPRDATSLQIAANSHPGLLLLKRRPHPDTGRMMNVLPVDEIRRLSGFFGMTSAAGGWRVALIDSADDMNEAAANALLKLLEEPPRHAMLLILAHAPGSTLPTVRSRCQLLSLRPLNAAQMRSALLPHLPDASPDEIDRLIHLSGGAPGTALRLADGDGLTLAEEADKMLEQAGAPDIAALLVLAEKLGRMENGLGRFGDFLIQAMTMRLRAAAKCGRPGLDTWMQARDAITEIGAKAKGLYLDPRQSVLAMADATSHAASRAGPL